MTNIILTGDKQLDRALSQFEPKFQKKGIRKATRDAAKEVLTNVKRLVPVRTGLLRRSLTVRTARTGFRGKKLPRGTLGHEVTTREGSFFSGETFYGGILEYGTKNARKPSSRGGLLRNIVRRLFGTTSTSGSGRRIEPRRFMRKGLYETKPTFKEKFRTTLASALEQVAREVRK